MQKIQQEEEDRQKKPHPANLARDFIQINPKNDLEFFADAYCSSVLMRVIENLLLQRPFHYKIKARKKMILLITSVQNLTT